MLVYDEGHHLLLTLLRSHVLHEQTAALSAHGGDGSALARTKSDGDTIVAIGHADAEIERGLSIQTLG